MEILAAGMYDLGLTAAEVSALTPRHLTALHKRRGLEQEHQTRLFCFLAAQVYNLFRDTEKKPEPFTADDFMGTPKEENIDEHAEAQAARFESFIRKAEEQGVTSPIKAWRPNGRS